MELKGKPKFFLSRVAPIILNVVLLKSLRFVLNPCYVNICGRLTVSPERHHCSLSTAQIEAQDVGKIYKVRIYHDGKGIGDGWFLEAVDIKRLTMAMVQVEVKKEEPKKDKKKDKKKKKKEEEEVEIVEELKEVVVTYNFPCNRWLARDEEDGEIVVELLAEDNEDLESKQHRNANCKYDVCRVLLF